MMVFGDINNKSFSAQAGYLFTVILLIFSDFVGISSAFYIATIFRRLLIPLIGGSVFWPSNILVGELALGATLVLFFFSGLYPGYGLTAVREIEIIVKSLSFIFGFLGTTFYFLKVSVDFPRSIILIAWGLSIFLIPIIRFFLRNRLSLTSLYGDTVLFIAGDKKDFSSLNAVIGCRRMGWRPIICNQISGTSEIFQEGDVEKPYIPSWEEIQGIKEKYSINTVLLSGELANKRKRAEGEIELLRSLSGIFKRIILVYPEHTFGSVWVKPRDIKGQLSLEMHYHLLDSGAIVLKRIFDIVGSILLIAILSPLFVLLSILICLDSSGPVLFHNDRVGRNGNIFGALKFRTMYKNSDKILETIKFKDSSRWELMQNLKKSGDPRVTPTGKWLRKFSIDELPQLWNVFRGEMSLVGPRAYLPVELNEMGDYSPLILRIRPGITGWWQVMGRHNTSFEERLRLDEYYISNWSLWLDFYITFKTVWVLLSGKGA